MDRKYWKKDEVVLFKKRLLSLRGKITGNVDALQNEAFKNAGHESSGDLSNMPIHLADVGTDNFDRDLTIEFIENAEEGLRNIDTALEKLENKTYGRCESCDKMVTKTRLLALPFVKNCIHCQRDEETEQMSDEES